MKNVNVIEVIFMILTKNSSVVTNDNQRPRKYPRHQKHLQRYTCMHFHTLPKLPYRGIFTCWWRSLLSATSKFGQATQCNQKAPIPVSSGWLVRSEKVKKRLNHSYHQRSSPQVSLNWSNDKIRFIFNELSRKIYCARLADIIKHLSHNPFSLPVKFCKLIH